MGFFVFAILLLAFFALSGKRPPTQKMRQYAEDVARSKGLRLDAKTLRSFSKTRRFLNANGGYKIHRARRR